MIYIALPPSCQQRQLTFYLAMEEYIARHMDAEECFFMWQVEPTVIFGRNQLIAGEVNTNYCRNHNINMFRRKSGGGCVYADMSNIMFSFVSKTVGVNLTFGKYIEMVTQMLRKLGVDATASGRNDIMIDGRKVSGNAFYHAAGKSIVHGTMLYDTNMQNMVGAITPSDAKLVSKGVKSVRKRIALLKDYTPLSIERFKTFAKAELCDKEIMLNNEAIEHIEQIEQEYLSPEFIYGNNPRYNKTLHGRIEGVGEFVVDIELKNNIIKNINIAGDFFLTGDIGACIIDRLRGAKLTVSEVSRVLPRRLDDIILNLRKEDFIKMICPTDIGE